MTPDERIEPTARCENDDDAELFGERIDRAPEVLYAFLRFKADLKIGLS